jgi:branched-chain amino acid transport system substrate-binding protein
VAPLIVGLLLLAACASGAQQGGAGGGSAEPVKLGAVFDISGRASFYGNSHRDSALLAVEEINAAGGLKGRPVELIIYDGESDETKSLLALRRLIDQDKVLAVLGPSLTGTVLAAADTINRAGVTSITPAAGVAIVDPVKPWIFSISQHDRYNVAKGLDWLRNKRLVRLALLSESSALGTQGRDELQAQAPNYGVTIVASETFGDKDVDVTPQLTAIRSQDFDAIVVWGSSATAAIAAKNARQLGIQVPMLQGAGVAGQTFIDTAGSAAETQHLLMTKLVLGDRLPDSDPQKAQITHFQQAFKAKYQRDADGFGANLYDAVYVLVDAMKRAELERKAIRDAVEQTKNYPGVNGGITFGPDRHHGVAAENITVGTVKDGRFVPAE